ncbi:unnamed protein product [Amoebophrya sp. A120]|nr:unnamed protein product [Amoebophrya sp. A120]|eukprot:GSA120T00007968001.1
MILRWSVPLAAWLVVVLQLQALLKFTLAAEFEFPIRNGRNQFSTVIGVGTPPQFFPMLLDSGSEEVWVPGPKCRECDEDGKFFNPADSTTFGNLPEVQKSAGYASGEVWYHEVFENVTCPAGSRREETTCAVTTGKVSFLQGGSSSCVGLAKRANATATTVRLPIGLTDRESPVFQSMPFDGIIGLAPSKSNFVEALYESGNLKHRQLGISLLPNVQKMFLGDMGPEKAAKMEWIPNAEHDGYWSVPNVALSYLDANNEKHDIPGVYRVVLDSGSSVAMMTESTQQMVKSLVPCKSQLSLRFSATFQHAIDVFVHTRRQHSKGLVLGADCNLDVMDLSGFPDDMLIMGKDFFEQVETWFDWDSDRIGFVKA